MISSATYKTNIICEVMNTIGKKYPELNFIAMEPSSKAPHYGYDMAIGNNGRAMLLQFCSPKTLVNGYSYLINDIKTMDRHLRLLHLEHLGHPVFYVMPLYHLMSQMVAAAGKISLMAGWFRPSWIPMPENFKQEYTVIYNSKNNSWRVKAKEDRYMAKSLTFNEVTAEFMKKSWPHNLETLIYKTNDIVKHGIEQHQANYIIENNRPMPVLGACGTDFFDSQLMLSAVPTDGDSLSLDL